MKTLKFSKNLIPLIISGKKDTTWRLFDDKDLKEGDEVIFLDKETKKPFTKVLLIKVQEKTFKQLAEEDKEGHEAFKSEEEMLKTYSDYYRTEVNIDTPLKVIKFKLKEVIQ